MLFFVLRYYFCHCLYVLIYVYKYLLNRPVTVFIPVNVNSLPQSSANIFMKSVFHCVVWKGLRCKKSLLAIISVVRYVIDIPFFLWIKWHLITWLVSCNALLQPGTEKSQIGSVKLCYTNATLLFQIWDNFQS